MELDKPPIFEKSINELQIKRIAIIGSGGVGGYFGGKLAKAGFDVSFIARGKHLTSIRKNGLMVKSILGDFIVDKVFATDKITELRKPDLAILGVKAWQIKNIAPDLSTILHQNTIILPLQNGINTIDELNEQIDKSHILGGLCRIMSEIEKPGIIKHTGVTPTIIFGELNKFKSGRLRIIKEIFDRSSINSRISLNIESELWKKFIPICLSGLLAISKTTYGELRELKETRQLMIDLLNEVYKLSQQMGINIESEFLNKTLSFIDSFPYNSTSSLTRDIWEGNPSELEYQNGTVVKLGEKYGIETPINRFIYNCLLPMEIKARDKSPT